jgi:hypothetical protein
MDYFHRPNLATVPRFEPECEWRCRMSRGLYERVHMGGLEVDAHFRQRPDAALIMGASMGCSCVAAAGHTGVTSSPIGSGGGGSGPQPKQWRARSTRGRIARDWATLKLQLQQHERAEEDTRGSPPPCQNRSFSSKFGRPQRVVLDLNPTNIPNGRM